MSSLNIPNLLKSRSRSTSKVSVNSVHTDGQHESETGYLIGLQERLLAECAGLTSDRDWDQALVLEIGCGCGDTTRRLADRLPLVREVLGIDIDSHAIDYAFAVHADERVDFATVDVEDVKTFDLKWASRFDWLFSSHSMLWVKQQTDALRNLMWCLRPGGRCFIAVPAGKPHDLHSAVTKVVQSSSWKKYFESISEVVSDMADANYNRLWFHHPQADRVYSALFEQVGYEVLKTKQVEFKYTFSSDAEYKECVLNLFLKPIELIPEEKRAAFIKDLLKHALKKAKKNKKGQVTWVIKYVLVVARRPDF